MPTTIFLTSETSWTVPSDWNNNDNKIECIGGGAGGSIAADWEYHGGGGGGAYAKKNNASLPVGSSVPYSIGVAGEPGVDGGDTWFGHASYASAIVGAKGGDRSSAIYTGGPGGLASACIGDVKYSGGDGYPAYYNGGASRGGGGGAAGPNGAGGAAHPKAGSTSCDGGDADNGYGGLGGSDPVSPTTGSEWGVGYGSGGGGFAIQNNLGATSGATFGGGGAGKSTYGGQGLIIITYTPFFTPFPTFFRP